MVMQHIKLIQQVFNNDLFAIHNIQKLAAMMSTLKHQ